MSLIKKWRKSDGSILPLNEYKSLSSAAYRKEIPLEDFFSMYGVSEVYTKGELQDPVNNSAELTQWVKQVDGEWRFLTKWKYKQYFEDLQGKDTTIREYLLSMGFHVWKELFEESITGWIHMNTKDPLTRKQYVKINNKLSDGQKIQEELLRLGYVKLNEKRKQKVV